MKRVVESQQRVQIRVGRELPVERVQDRAVYSPSELKPEVDEEERELNAAYGDDRLEPVGPDEKSIQAKGSIFEPSYVRALEKTAFLDTMSERITRPVMPDDEASQSGPYG